MPIARLSSAGVQESNRLSMTGTAGALATTVAVAPEPELVVLSFGANLGSR